MEGTSEHRMLAELSRRGSDGTEAARSLALGSVLRARLTPEQAAQHCAYTAQELRDLTAGLVSDARSPTVLLSVVVPAMNEEENLDALWQRLRPVFDSAGESELVIVDDGSVDDTWKEILRLTAADPRVRGVRLTRNFGHQAALTAGMAQARGQTVCFLDADLQDPPELIARLLEEWRTGNDVVYAVRRSRSEGMLKRSAHYAFHRIYQRLANIDVPLGSGDFALIDRSVVDEMIALPEHNRFLRGLRSWVGHQQVGVEYDRDPRHAGEPKYTARKLLRLGFDGILSFSAVPLRLASYLGVLVALAGGLYVAVAVAYRLWFGGIPDGWTSIIAVILTIGGIQLIVLGVLGEYIARVYDETKGRPNYLIAEVSGPGDPA